MTEPSSKNSELLEIYKLHAEFSDRVAQRREGANRLYVGILTGFLVAVVALTRLGLVDIVSNVLTLVGGLVGIIFCLSWYLLIRSYRQLNTSKFAVLHELEEKLSFAFFKREWEKLEEGKGVKKYLNSRQGRNGPSDIVWDSVHHLVIWGFVELIKGL